MEPAVKNPRLGWTLAAKEVDFGTHGGVVAPFLAVVGDSWDRGTGEMPVAKFGLGRG